MRKILMGLLTLCVIFWGCGSAPLETAKTFPPTPAPPPSVQVTPQNPEVVSAQSPEPLVAKPTPQAGSLTQDGKELQELMGAAKKRIKSYQYLYRDRRPNTEYRYPIAGKFSIKGDRVKVEIIQQNDELSARQANQASSDASLYRPTLYGDQEYDTFYLNTAKKIAYGDCLSQFCPQNVELTEVEYMDFIRKTPADWRDEIPMDSVEIIDNKQVSGQNIYRARYMQEGQPIVQWLEEYSMLPIKIEIGEGKSLYTIEFGELAPNTVSDKVFDGVPI